MDEYEGMVLDAQEFNTLCHVWNVRSKKQVLEGTEYEAVQQYYSVSTVDDDEPIGYMWLSPDTAKWVWLTPEMVDEDVIALFD